MLFNLQFQAQQFMLFHLNCVVAQELAVGIDEAAKTFRWWEAEPQSKPDDLLPMFNTEQDTRAWNAVSLTTGAAPNGLLVNLSDGDKGRFRFFLPRSLARRVFISIHAAGQTANWWDKEFNLLPAQMPDDTVILRAANQMIKQHGDRAAAETAQRSDASMALGDMFNHRLWDRVRIAVQDLERAKPDDTEKLN